jgi:hypothetical protein
MAISLVPIRSSFARIVLSLALGVGSALSSLPGLAQGVRATGKVQQSQINVMVSDGGGLDAQTTRTLRALTVSELRKLGHAVNDDPAWEGIHPAGEDTKALMQRFGGRTLALRVAGRLGAKVPLTLEEMKADGNVVVSTSLTAGSLEECDIVIPRLVEALLGRKPVEDTARMTTVTTVEARPFEKRPGEGRFVIGVLNPLFGGDGDGGKNGLSLGYMFEAEHFLVGVEGLYVSSGNSHIGSQAFLQGAWLPLSGQFSPYLGVGVGYLSGSDEGLSITDGTAFKLTAGLEMFRLHRLRILVGLDVYFPTSSRKGTKYHYQYDYINNRDLSYTEQVTTRSSFPVLHIKLAF